MPGGRLTNQDRRRIAAGLTAGLGYAEIARKLGRPTSTVSREVTRNGGGAEYRADRAHRATGQRARRTPPAMGPAAGTPDAVRGFVDEFAALMVHTGLPRMAARVFTALVTTDSGALTAAELVGGLRVSPASVSKAVGYLEGLDLVRRERDQRRERYVIDEDLWLRTWLTSARTNAALADTAQRGTEVFPATTPTGARLDHMRRFFAQLSEDMAGGPDGLDDLLTVAAALVHAAAPRTAAQVAAALGWPVDRVAGALRDAESRPDQTDPVAVRQIGGGAYAVTVKPGRLTAAQCSALSLSFKQFAVVWCPSCDAQVGCRPARWPGRVRRRSVALYHGSSSPQGVLAPAASVSALPLDVRFSYGCCGTPAGLVPGSTWPVRRGVPTDDADPRPIPEPVGAGCERPATARSTGRPIPDHAAEVAPSPRSA